MLNFFTGNKYVSTRVQKELEDFKKELSRKTCGKNHWKMELLSSLYRK